MSTRLTYTSGALGSDTDREFEERLGRARETAPEALPHHIGGGERTDGEEFDRRDPCSDDSVASRAREAGPELVGEAIGAAREAAQRWRTTPYGERCELLRAVANGI